MIKIASIERQWAARFENLLVEEKGDDESETPREVSLIHNPLELLTPEEMGKADSLTMANGTPGSTLMEAAGLAVAEAVHDLLPEGGKVAVMTGPGNNGGDGFVAARLLSEAGYTVNVGLLVGRDKLSGDAGFAAAAWTGSSKGLGPGIADGVDLVVDALFGAGLDRPLTGGAAAAINAVNASGVPVVAVDLPSGVHGGTGQVLGTAIQATQTVTFFRLKPGHLLNPGRTLAGRIMVADIGIDAKVLSQIQPQAFRNRPGLWTLPELDPSGHKYDRGHVVVVSGPATRTGAARLAARGALRAGAGLVSMASTPDALAVNAMHLTAIMLLPMEDAPDLSEILSDTRRNVVALGPALGVGADTAALVEAALDSQAAVVIDADGLTSFADWPHRMFVKAKGRSAPTVLTPHEGEFGRLFQSIDKSLGKVERARAGAVASGAVVVLKGSDTVVAAPDGRVTVADNAPPVLATAGSGDVLTGVVAGMLAQGMPAFEAASAAVWMHGAAGAVIGRGLVAEDIPEALPSVFSLLAAE